jgi:ferredoxin-NADP reductase
MSGTATSARTRYHGLPVLRVATETDEASSFVLGVPAELVPSFAYRAGQFVNVRVAIDGEARFRSYSMSSAPATDPELRVTVKRVPGGLVSNWLIDHVGPGDVLDVSVPTGSFVLEDGAHDVMAFAAGSGITPVLSIVKQTLHTTGRRVRLLYANRDQSSTIFAASIDALVTRYPDRLVVRHHRDAERGLVDIDAVTTFVGEPGDVECFVCGPAPFMDLVLDALARTEIRPDRVRVERFTPPDAASEPPDAATEPAEPGPGEVTIRFERRTVTARQRGRSTILQTARSAGLNPPSSCENGSCATCMARVVSGRVEMRNNEVLDPEEVDEGWVLTCQAVPVSPDVEVVYE